MSNPEASSSFIIPADTDLFHTLQRVLESDTVVFFAGLPGVGKSLLIQQLAILAADAGRPFHMLQWDIARAPFQTDAILERYPEVDEISHSVIRKAAGLWARDAVLRWHREHQDTRDLLIGETPLVGNRLIELAKPADDDCEGLLRDDQTRFLVPIPSREIREVIERARLRSSERPRHERELSDAMPNIMRALWQELFTVASRMGVVDGNDEAAVTDYDPEAYSKVYASVLRHRRYEAVPLDIPLDSGRRSVYEIDTPHGELVATEDEAAGFIDKVEQLYPDLRELERETTAWYEV